MPARPASRASRSSRWRPCTGATTARASPSPGRSAISTPNMTSSSPTCRAPGRSTSPTSAGSRTRRNGRCPGRWITRPRSAGGTFDVNTTLSWRSKTFQFETPSPFLDQEGYALWDANLIWTSRNDRWSIGLHAKNILDKQYITSGYQFLTVNPVTGVPLLNAGGTLSAEPRPGGCRDHLLRQSAAGLPQPGHEVLGKPARRNCEGSEAIQWLGRRTGLLRRFAPRNDGSSRKGLTGWQPGLPE